MTSFYSGGYRGDSCGSLEPPFETKQTNFQKNQHKLSNYQLQFSNRTPICKFERPCFYSTIYLFLFTWASPYGIHVEPSYTAHMGPMIYLYLYLPDTPNTSRRVLRGVCAKMALILVKIIGI